MLNALSVDVEECFHASEVGATPEDWDSLPARVEPQTRRVLELLDRHSVKATFFILGWVARRHPRLVREIVAAGHEIGCHSYAHQLVYRLTPAEFVRNTETAVQAIADACGQRPRIYRAPSYSITAQSLWALEFLVSSGFTHDSSIYPIAHDRYGMPEFGPCPRLLTMPSGSLFEVPIATVGVFGSQLPVGGGGYLRLLPYRYTAAGIRRLNTRDSQPACMYFHPWELDPAQPRLSMGRISRLRTYSGLGGMEAKLNRLLADFRFSTITTVYPLRDHVTAPPAGVIRQGLPARSAG
jgi:polysaccharide deacetylase family protein (PEP-CTERM system associated)